MEHLKRKYNTYFINSNEAFLYWYDQIRMYGIDFDNTKALFNIGFYIKNPNQRNINVDFRNWSKKYAEREWNWYLSKNRSVSELKKHAPIWDKMHSGDNIVNSNYGYQWTRNNQLDFAIDKLKKNSKTRQAVITILDQKEHEKHNYDTPCTNSIHFQIINNKLCMTVNMRSNDLWYGFCNDQYCFSKLQELVSNQLNIKIGWYYHFASNFHLYK